MRIQPTQAISTAVLGALLLLGAGPGWALTPTEVAKLTALDAMAGDQFGRSVALAGDTAIIGADLDDDKGTNSGSAYVFTRMGTNWMQQAKLTASDGAAFAEFGFSVALDGDTAIIGAFADDDAGSAYVFTRMGTTWMQQAKLTASDAMTGDEFGSSVTLADDTAVIGAPRDDDAGSNSGSAYVFTRSGSTWTEQVKLTASDGATSDRFGGSVALDDDTAVIGARFDDDAGTSSGSAYVFTKPAGGWVDTNTETAKLTAGDAAAGDRFGFSIALAGDTAIIGAIFDDDEPDNSGSAYVFTRSAGTWTEQAKLTALDAAAFDEFGFSIALAGDTAIIGAIFDDDAGLSSGSAYVFSLVSDTDDDGDGVDNAADVCPLTVIPEFVPTMGLKPNHWALLDTDFNFDTVSKGKHKGKDKHKGKGKGGSGKGGSGKGGSGKGGSAGRSYTTADTAGCSCEQIIERQGLGRGHTKHGCRIRAMDDWVDVVNP